MKIGLFTDTFTPQINGVVTVLQMMVREFSSRGHEAIVFAPAYPNQPEEDDTQTLRLPSRKVNFHPESRLTWPYRRKVPTVLAELDLIHSHTPFTLGLLALWASRHYRLAHIHTYHTYFSEYRHYIPRPVRPTKRVAERISRAFCDRCDLVLAPSEEMKNALGKYGVKTPVEALPFGIDLDAFQQPIHFDLRKAWKISPETRVLLTAGRLGSEKNFGFVIEAFAHIHQALENTVLVIAGDGPSRKELEQRAQTLGVEDAVRFPGYVDRTQLIDCYHQADVFVFASKTETQGIVLLEAQAAGTPVVAVGEMGVLDVVDDGVSGHLVAEDEAVFARAVLDLLKNETTYRRFCEGALSLAQANSSSKTCEHLLMRYQSLLKHPALTT